MPEDSTFNYVVVDSLMDSEVLLSYKGLIDNYFLTVFINHINIHTADRPEVGRKINSVMIELSQNILYYSEDRKSFAGSKTNGVGILQLREKDDCFILSAGNVVKNKDINILSDRCDEINALDRDNLRKMKRENRRYVEKNKVGANIGLIQAALISSNKLEYQINEIDQKYSFFMLTTKFLKNN